MTSMFSVFFIRCFLKKKKKKKICKLNTVRSTVDFNSPAGAEEVSLKAKNGLHNSGGHDRSSLVLNVSSEKIIKRKAL